MAQNAEKLQKERSNIKVLCQDLIKQIQEQQETKGAEYHAIKLNYEMKLPVAE